MDDPSLLRPSPPKRAIHETSSPNPSTTQSFPPRKRSRSDPPQRQEVPRVRRSACSECRRRKVRCLHSPQKSLDSGVPSITALTDENSSAKMHMSALHEVQDTEMDDVTLTMEDDWEMEVEHNFVPRAPPNSPTQAPPAVSLFATSPKPIYDRRNIAFRADGTAVPIVEVPGNDIFGMSLQSNAMYPSPEIARSQEDISMHNSSFHVQEPVVPSWYKQVPHRPKSINEQRQALQQPRIVHIPRSRPAGASPKKRSPHKSPLTAENSLEDKRQKCMSFGPLTFGVDNIPDTPFTPRPTVATTPAKPAKASSTATFQTPSQQVQNRYSAPVIPTQPQRESIEEGSETGLNPHAHNRRRLFWSTPAAAASSISAKSSELATKFKNLALSPQVRLRRRDDQNLVSTPGFALSTPTAQSVVLARLAPMPETPCRKSKGSLKEFNNRDQLGGFGFGGFC